MLQQIISDPNIIFIVSHALLIGVVAGYFFANIVTRSLRKKLRSQSQAYEDLMNSIESTPPEKSHSAAHLQVIRMDTTTQKVSGMGV
jgi:uncharacterized protein YneF (UPF0154 family)